MSILSRIGKVAKGFGSAVESPFGLVYDLARAPFTDDDVDGILNTLYTDTVKRGGQALGGLVGPQGVGGELFGAVPEPVRHPVASVTEPILSGLETAYHEGVGQPISTALTAASLAQERQGGGGLGGIEGLFKGRNWSDAYHIAEHRSPGQAFALAVGTKHITDPKEVYRFQGTDSYKMMSGLADAVIRWELDPTVLGGRALGAAREAYLVRPVESADTIIQADRRLSKFNQALEGMNAGQIRDRFFPEHAHGAFISTLLTDAATPEERMLTLKSMLGDVKALDRLSVDRADLAGQINRALDNTRVAKALSGPGTLWHDSATVTQAQAEVDRLYDVAARQERLDRSFARMGQIPRSDAIGTLRTAVTRTDFYQHSPFAAPLRRVFTMTPHLWLNLHDATGDVHLNRMLQHTPMELAERESWRAEYMAQTEPMGRLDVLSRAEEAAVGSIADKVGMTPDELQAAVSQARAGRAQAMEIVKSRIYDGAGRSKYSWLDEDGTLHEVNLPAFVTQEMNFAPVADTYKLQRVATRIGEFRARMGPAAQIPSELLNSFYAVWRPTTLLRFGWPFRVVGDEQLRILAKIGAMAHLKGLNTGLRNRLMDRLGEIPNQIDAASQAEGFVNRLQAFHAVGAEAAAERVTTRGALAVTGPTGRVYDLESAFGVPGDRANIWADLVSSRASFEKLYGIPEDGSLRALREHTGQWQSIPPTDPAYGAAWEHAVNKQIAGDVLGRKIVEGASVDDAERWLTDTADGQAYTRRLNGAGPRVSPHERAQIASDIAGDYLPHPELRDLALRGKATSADLARVIPDAADRPIVHGELLNAVTGRSTLGRGIRGVRDLLFRKLGSQPSDVLSRQPFFDAMYQAESRRVVNLLDEQFPHGIPAEKMQQIEIGAREYALGETKKLLYDLAEESDLARMLKFVMPFFPAWQEVITRWAGLAVENPAFVARGRLVWNSPEKAGIVVDENGAIVHADGTATFNGRKVKPGSERFLNWRLPTWAHDIPGLKTMGGSIKVSKTGFNLALQGAPGFGPPVQIPVNEIAKSRPDLEKSLSFVLPYGTTQKLTDLLLPATARRLSTRLSGEDDRSYANTLLRIYFDKITDYNLGKRDTKPTYGEAKKEADAFFNLRMFASYVSPAAPQFSSPYQPYIDAYRDARERYFVNKDALVDDNGVQRTPDEWFLDTYGKEYFPLTQSLSRSVDGVPPTVEAWAASKKYRDLLQKFPEFGALIVGQEGAGEFSRAVYDAQFATKVRPGSGQHERETPPFEEQAVQPDVRLGWLQYGRYMDLIEAARVQQGLPNLNVKAAAGLQALKSALVQQLATEHPQWYAEFSTHDDLAFDRRIEGLRVLAADKRLQGRSEFRMLGQYLDMRDAVQAVLASRPHSTLTAGDNADVANLWHAFTGSLVEKDLAFSSLFYRWLERDALNQSRLPAVA